MSGIPAWAYVQVGRTLYVESRDGTTGVGAKVITHAKQTTSAAAKAGAGAAPMELELELKLELEDAVLTFLAFSVYGKHERNKKLRKRGESRNVPSHQAQIHFTQEDINNYL